MERHTDLKRKCNLFLQCAPHPAVLQKTVKVAVCMSQVIYGVGMCVGKQRCDCGFSHGKRRGQSHWEPEGNHALILNTVICGPNKSADIAKKKERERENFKY